MHQNRLMLQNIKQQNDEDFSPTKKNWVRDPPPPLRVVSDSIFRAKT